KALRQEGEKLVAEITEHFRYLHGEQVNWVFHLAESLRDREINEAKGLLPYVWPVAKLREIHDYLLFLRQHYGSELPADEKDYWTDEDRDDLQRATWRRLDEEDPWPEDGYPLEEEGNAQAG